jgi:hypothetical protein
MAACETSNAGGANGLAPHVILSFDIGIKNLGTCAFSVTQGQPAATMLFWKVLSLAQEKERTPTVNELALRLFSTLDEVVAELESKDIKIDTVLLENQPSRLNGAMKSLQMMIYSYFQLRRHWEGFVSSVFMISASQKLLGHTHVIADPPKPKTGYQLNKWRAVQFAEVYIKDCEELVTLFRSHKKKDDLSDAFLQGVSWARKHGYTIESAKADAKAEARTN